MMSASELRWFSGFVTLLSFALIVSMVILGLTGVRSWDVVGGPILLGCMGLCVLPIWVYYMFGEPKRDRWP